MNNCYFVSFADSKYQRALNRIKSEALNMDFFDNIFCLSEKDLDQDFIKKHNFFISNNKRGYGYFIWKPQIILQILNIIPENSFLLYADAGCTLNKEGIPRLKEYIEIANQNNILAFHMNYKECWWTKMDVFARLDFMSESNFESRQCSATTHVWKNSLFSKDFVKHYLTVCEYYPNIDDSPSFLPNHPEFKEHRHDQSVFSILIKKANIATLPDETWWEPYWQKYTNYPVHATRYR